ncbi:MAG: hypothetical protein J7K15_02055 [Deltaproteobacteria bacterium]|nr:hypothetical protein [Deltaproteobacteria bacterium]
MEKKKGTGWASASWEIYLLARMNPEREFSDDDIKRRFKIYYGEDSRRNLSEGQIPFLRNNNSKSHHYHLSNHEKPDHNQNRRWQNL